MTKDEFDAVARDFLSSASSDESWIDASSGFARSSLSDLLEAMYERGHEAARQKVQHSDEWLDALAND